MLWADAVDLLARLMALAPVGTYGTYSAIALVIARRLPPEVFGQVFADVSRRRTLVYAWIGVATMLGVVAWSLFDVVYLILKG